MTANLQKAITALQDLPSDAQDAIAADLLERVTMLQTSCLTPEQQAVVDARLSQPIELAAQSDVTAVFSKY